MHPTFRAGYQYNNSALESMPLFRGPVQKELRKPTSKNACLSGHEGVFFTEVLEFRVISFGMEDLRMT